MDNEKTVVEFSIQEKFGEHGEWRMYSFVDRDLMALRKAILAYRKHNPKAQYRIVSRKATEWMPVDE